MNMILCTNNEIMCAKYIFKSIKSIVKIFNENVMKNVKKNLMRRICL